MVYHSDAVLVADFGTFGQGMPVNWQYTVPEGGSVTTALNLRDCSDIPLHIKPEYGSNAKSVTHLHVLNHFNLHIHMHIEASIGYKNEWTMGQTRTSS